jgi:hypothetical protein
VRCSSSGADDALLPGVIIIVVVGVVNVMADDIASVAH